MSRQGAYRLSGMETTNLADLYGTPLLDWDRITTGLEAGISQAPGTGGPDRHTCWLATIDRDGSPHVTGVGALWADGSFWFETGGGTRKGRNLARDPRCTLSVATLDFDLVVEGEAHRVTDPATVATMAEQWAAEGWPALVSTSPAPRSRPTTARPRPGPRRGSSTASPCRRPRPCSPSIPVARPAGASEPTSEVRSSGLRCGNLDTSRGGAMRRAMLGVTGAVLCVALTSCHGPLSTNTVTIQADCTITVGGSPSTSPATLHLSVGSSSFATPGAAVMFPGRRSTGWPVAPLTGPVGIFVDATGLATFPNQPSLPPWLAGLVARGLGVHGFGCGASTDSAPTAPPSPERWGAPPRSTSRR